MRQPFDDWVTFQLTRPARSGVEDVGGLGGVGRKNIFPCPARCRRQPGEWRSNKSEGVVRAAFLAVLATMTSLFFFWWRVRCCSSRGGWCRTRLSLPKNSGLSLAARDCVSLGRLGPGERAGGRTFREAVSGHNWKVPPTILPQIYSKSLTPLMGDRVK